MRRSAISIALLVLGMGCNKGEDKAAPVAKGAESSGETTKVEPSKTTDVGVQAGGIEREASEGPSAVVTAVQGKVEVRRLGETEFKDAKAEDKLYAGDAIRTGDESTATVALADESIVEVAEVTTLAVASRQASADPASGAAVLAGLARFTVTPRAPGEGAFRVYTPAGIVLTKGTVYGVGVAASGDARVGVEQGSVDVIGLAAIDAKPISVDAGSQVLLEAKGSVAAPAPWPSDDWGTWRDTTDAKVDVVAAVDAHAAAMMDLDANIRAAYADLDASADTIATFEAKAATAADSNDPAAYQASLPDGAATIDASFSLAGRLEALTWAHAARATLATDLYVRHPANLERKWTVIAPRVDAAILWPKRYEVTAAAYLEPLHVQYYVHHPRGRLHAPLVGVVVPDFYAKVELPVIEPARVRARVKTPIWIAPEMRYTASARPIWITAPAVDWNVRVKATPAPFRAKVGWYMRPPALKAKVLVAAPVSASYTAKLKVAAPAPRASLIGVWKIPVGAKVRVGAPNFDVAAKARASWKVGVGVAAPDPAIDARAKLKVAVPAPPTADVRAKVKVAVPDPRAKVKVVVPDVKAGIGVKVGGGVKAGAGVRGDAKAKAGAAIKVKAPEVKVKAPQVKVKGEVKGKVKIGL